jgi:predicted AlkP superfamily phosphohydrolase/phosphomutase
MAEGRGSKVVVIGVDVAEIDLIELGVREGWLPTIRGLLERGQSVRLYDELSSLFSAQWATLVTGVAVADHLHIGFERLRPGTCAIEIGTLQAPPFWSYISDAGRPSTILSVYAAPMLHGLRGTQVIGWGSADAGSALVLASEPAEAWKWLEEEIPERRAGFLRSVPTTIDEMLSYLDAALEGVDQQRRGISLLMERTAWDFFFAGFPESHDAGHFLWRFHDASHDEHDPSAPSVLQAGFRSVTERIDRAIGELLEKIPSDATVLLVSGHGMAAIPRPVGAASAVLERAGFLSKVDAWAPSGSPGRRLLRMGRTVVDVLLPLSVRRAIGHAIPRLRTKLVQATALADVDWSTTRAFIVLSLESTHVRVNLAGREPKGIVSPGHQYDELLKEIEEVFRELVHADTGEPVVEDVIRTEALTGRPVGDVLPDMIVAWKRGSPRRITSPRLGTIEVPWNDHRSGEHSPYGFVIGAGPGITPSGRLEISEEVRQMVDFAPTVLELLGVEPPPALAGRAIAELTGRVGYPSR